MLIDLDWTLDTPGKRAFAGCIRKFDNTNGSLYIEIQYSPEKEVWKRQIATKIHKGIYRAIDLWNDIENYTKWNVEHPWDRPQKIFNALLTTTDKEEKEMLKYQFKRIKESFGTADNLKQIIKYGHQYLNCPEPYVLGFYPHKTDERYMRKNGIYIGKKKNPEEVLAFSFHKLIPKT